MDLKEKGSSFIVLTLILINLIIYFNGIKNEFVWDDSYIVRDNYLIRDVSNVKKLLTAEDKPAVFSGRGYFRPFINLTFMADYQIFKGGAYGYRLTNIAFHILCSVMLFLLVMLITSNRLLSFTAALIFSAQAVHVEAVTFISGRNNVVCAFFMLVSLYYYIKNDKESRFPYLILSMLFLFIGAMSKEFAFVLPLIFILYDYTFGDDFSVRKHILKYAASFSVLMLFMVYRALFIPMTGAFRINYPTLYLRVINTSRVFINYIRCQIIPLDLSIYFNLPIKNSIFAPEVLLSFLMLAGLVLLVICFRKKDRVLFFSFFAYLILLLPISNIVEIPGAMMADRWIYPASLAFALFLARLIFLAFKEKERLITLAVIVFVLSLSFFTLGTEYRNRGLIDEAEMQYLLAIKYKPDYNLPYNNLGVLYGLRKDHNKALGYFKKAYELNPTYALTPFNMAVTYDDIGALDESNKYYEIAISLNPEDFNSYYNLASNYYRQKKYEESLEVLKRALDITYDEVKKEEINNKIKMVTDVIGMPPKTD
jgi:tetratricopeptide (TPR) repeat protein